MRTFGYIEGADGTVLLQLDHLDGQPGDAPELALTADNRASLKRADTEIALRDDRPDLIARIPAATAVHVVEQQGDLVTRCYPVHVTYPARGEHG